jgi:hypothetical protein
MGKVVGSIQRVNVPGVGIGVVAVYASLFGHQAMVWESLTQAAGDKLFRRLVIFRDQIHLSAFGANLPDFAEALAQQLPCFLGNIYRNADYVV